MNSARTARSTSSLEEIDTADTALLFLAIDFLIKLLLIGDSGEFIQPAIVLVTVQLSLDCCYVQAEIARFGEPVDWQHSTRSRSRTLMLTIHYLIHLYIQA